MLKVFLSEKGHTPNEIDPTFGNHQSLHLSMHDWLSVVFLFCSVLHSLINVLNGV